MKQKEISVLPVHSKAWSGAQYVAVIIKTDLPSWKKGGANFPAAVPFGASIQLSGRVFLP